MYGWRQRSGRTGSRLWIGAAWAWAACLVAACVVAPPATPMASEADAPRTLVVYSGRNENLVGPLLTQFAEETGIDVKVRYGNTAAMAATILEEGSNSPADVYYGQDAGALGALARAGRLQALPAALLADLNPAYVSRDGAWVGTSLRARVLVYNTDELQAADLPDDIWALTEETWRGRVGWAPTNGSFQAFVTALRVLAGEDAAKAWLEGMLRNDVQAYPKNTPIVAAAGAGEIAVGLVNHYYLLRFKAEDPNFSAANYHFRAAGPGSMVNVAGAGVVDSCANCAEAEEFIRYLLAPAAQTYFLQTTHEYPVVPGDFVYASDAVPLDDFDIPDIDLNDLDDLEGTLDLLRAVGALE